MQIIAKSEIGNVREINQDYISYKELGESEIIAVLCDGMGGHKAGEVASQLTCEYIINHFECHSPFTCDEDIQTWLNELINNANQSLMQQSAQKEEYEGMGTTVVVCYVNDGYCYISHVGDSRAYYLSDGKLTQLTRDDTLVNALVENGTITKDEALFHPKKNILLQAVGATDSLKVSFHKQVFENDLILICSDGLSNSLYDQQIIDILMNKSDIETNANELMKQSLVYGGRDNISFIIFDKGVTKDE